MSNIASYEDAVSAVRRRQRVRPFELAEDLGLDWATSKRYLNRMEHDGIVGPMSDLGWRDVLPERTRQHGRGGRDGPDEAFDGAASRGPGRAGLDRIAELEAQVARLKEAGKTIIQQREEWKARALAAEKLGSGGSAPGGDAGRYAALKRILARELHPDYAPGDGIERVVREAIFKKVWPQVEDMEKNG